MFTTGVSEKHRRRKEKKKKDGGVKSTGSHQENQTSLPQKPGGGFREAMGGGKRKGHVQKTVKKNERSETAVN